MTWEQAERLSVLLFFLPCEQFFSSYLSPCLAKDIVHRSVILLALSFEQLGQAAGDHVRDVHVVHWRVELAICDRIPLLRLWNVRRDEDVGGLVAVEHVAGSCYDFWRRYCRILPWRLLSAAGVDELSSSICWLLLSDAGGSGDELRSSTCWSVCRLLLSVCLLPLKRASCTGSLKRVASCLLLLKPTAMCLG
jgi:hypothetical protein